LSEARHYVGRFAPSPSGPLHFGSLVAALASYLDAKAHHGRWLMRMEDIDPPREQPGAADMILRCLEAHKLYWDGEVLYQSQRHQAYRNILDKLRQNKLIYRCACGRQQLREMPNGVYNGHCRHLAIPEKTPTSLRLNINAAEPPDNLHNIQFNDLFLGTQKEDLEKETGDFIIHRKDGLFAYQLAVVADDIFQGITHVVRGVDLLSSTARQIFLFRALGNPPPLFGHFPVVLNEQGDKLSKQTKAPPVDNTQATNNLLAALHFLLPSAPADLTSCEEIISWGIQHWRRGAIGNN